MKRLILMRGLPGSGKSTRAAQLFDTMEDSGYHAVILSADNFFMIDGEYKFNANWLRAAHTYTQGKCAMWMRDKLDCIIIDNTNTTMREMEPYIDMAQKFGYDIILAEPQTAWKFDVDECAKRNTHKVPRDKIQAMKDRWETREKFPMNILFTQW